MACSGQSKPASCWSPANPGGRPPILGQAAVSNASTTVPYCRLRSGPLHSLQSDWVSRSAQSRQCSWHGPGWSSTRPCASISGSLDHDSMAELRLCGDSSRTRQAALHERQPISQNHYSPPVEVHAGFYFSILVCMTLFSVLLTPLTFGHLDLFNCGAVSSYNTHSCAI
jgi:hypothetical protein